MKGFVSSSQKRDSREAGPIDQVNSIYEQLNRIKENVSLVDAERVLRLEEQLLYQALWPGENRVSKIVVASVEGADVD
jgi:regulator of replication initiation timing